jgi:hypothetical protein
VLLGARPGTLAGEWAIGTVAFEAIAAGDPRIRVAGIVARDASNRRIEVGAPVPPSAIPPVTALAPPAPNPFRQSAAFAVSLSQTGPVDLAIYAVDGRRVRTVLDGIQEAGEYRVHWDGRDQRGMAAAPGVYFVRLAAGARSYTRRIVYLR